MGLPAKQNEFQSVGIDRQEMGTADTFRYNVCSDVSTENYDRAIHTLRNILEVETEYPVFRGRIERYVLHAIDLVNAIRAKRRFPGVNYLTMAKRQELNSRFREHFDELQTTLKKIEKTKHDLRLDDSRSTVLLVQAVSISTISIFVVGFFLEIIQGLALTFWVVMDDGMNQVFSWLFKAIGL